MNKSLMELQNEINKLMIMQLDVWKDLETIHFASADRWKGAAELLANALNVYANLPEPDPYGIAGQALVRFAKFKDEMKAGKWTQTK